MEVDGEKRKLIMFRVDLREELERRNLDKAGVNAVLIERLKKALRDEGHDPDEYVFVSSGKKIVKRLSSAKCGEQDVECETHSNAEDMDEEHDEEVDADDNAKQGLKENAAGDEAGEPSQVKDEIQDKAPVVVLTADSAIDAKVELKAEDVPDEETKSQVEEVCSEADMNVPQGNGADIEDSINLTIGEDEKFLAEKEDSGSQEKETEDEDSALAGLDQQEAGGDASKKNSPRQEENIQTAEEESLNKRQEGQHDDKSAAGSKSPKEEKVDKKGNCMGRATSGSSRNLWVSGLSSSTSATDLTQAFSKYGKVICTKIVTTARTPGARCYGYVIMVTSEDATKCIQHLHRTELHGRMIYVERAKGDGKGPPREGDSKVSSNSVKEAEERKQQERRLSVSAAVKQGSVHRKSGEVTDVQNKVPDDGTAANVDPEGDQVMSGEDKEKVVKATDGVKKEGAKHHSREREGRHRRAGSSHYSHHSRSPNRQSRRPHHNSSPRRTSGVLTFAHIRDERERERELREEDRRRRNEVWRHREEATRLEREKERLRLERERIEWERRDLMRMQRECQRMERELDEPKRQQLRFEESRRTVKRPSSGGRDSYPEERKRVATEHSYYGTARFDDGARCKRGPSFRVRDERRSECDHRTKVDVRHSRDRYPESSKGESRYIDHSGDTWHAGGASPAVKPFSSVDSGGVPPRDSWRPSGDRKAYNSQSWEASDRWVSGSGGPMGAVGSGRSGMSGPGSMYSNPQNVAPNLSSMTMSMSNSDGPYGGDRFDAYKQSMGPIRKY